MGVTPYRVALANLRYPKDAADSVALVERAIKAAGAAGAGIICFPECYLPGYRRIGRPSSPFDQAFLVKAWAQIALAASVAKIAVVLGTERAIESAYRLTALVINADGSIAGFQDKVQLDPTEDDFYKPGAGRKVFTAGALTFGVVICHEGWRYPEATRAAVQKGAQLIFHPHFHETEPGAFVPTRFADPENTFHEKAVLCRAAENTCYFASVNCASKDSPTTSAIARPDGTLQCFQPYGEEGLLIADIDLSLATGLLAKRLRPAG